MSHNNYTRLTDSTTRDGCCLPLFKRKQKSEIELNRETLYTHDRISNRALELDMLCQGVKFKMTELTLEAKQHLEKHKDRERAVSCLQQRHSLQKQYSNLVRMYTNAKLMANKLTEAALYRKFSLALLESNQTLDDILSHLDYEAIETLMDKVGDQHYQVNELGELLATEPVTSDAQQQIALDIDAEIEELMEQEALLKTADLPHMSVISSNRVEKPSKKQREKEA